MIDFTMNFDLVPGIMIALIGPVVGIAAAAALSRVVFGFASLASKAIHRPVQPKPAPSVTALDHVRQVA